MYLNKQKRRQNRRGAIVVLAAFMMIGMLVMVGFAVDLGYLLVARTELQRTADSAAMAGAWELADEGRFKGDEYLLEAISDARSLAMHYAKFNRVCAAEPTLDPNVANASSGDVVVGQLANPSDLATTLVFEDPSQFNAVTVCVRRNLLRNGIVPAFFARAIGIPGFTTEARATAAMMSDIRGFRIPDDRSDVGILPIALDEPSWLALGIESPDQWCWDPQTREIRPWGDGIPELNLYPEPNDAAGNRGTVDIGSQSNSTDDIARQVVKGVSPEDLEYHGGTLEFDASGEMYLNGDTGISASIKDDLEQIKGKGRMIPIFREVVNPGDNATYTIVRFVGVRVLDVNLTGNKKSKRVIIQPAAVVSPGAIPAPGQGHTDLIFTPVQIVR